MIYGVEQDRLSDFKGLVLIIKNEFQKNTLKFKLIKYSGIVNKQQFAEWD